MESFGMDSTAESETITVTESPSADSSTPLTRRTLRRHPRFVCNAYQDSAARGNGTDAFPGVPVVLLPEERIGDGENQRERPCA